MNNRKLGMIREYQHYHFDNRYAMVDLSEVPEYSHIAQAYGIPYIKITRDEECTEKLKEVFRTKGPVFCEADIDPDAFTAN